jgi:hypothetical protein
MGRWKVMQIVVWLIGSAAIYACWPCQADLRACYPPAMARLETAMLLASALQSSRHKKAPDDAGAFEMLSSSRDQYFATTGPVQLKR